MTEQPIVHEKAWATEKPCELARYHAPEPAVTQGHHVHPVFLQNAVHGRIVDNELKWLCGSCHDAVHAWLYWLLGERTQPPHVGTLAKAEAQRSFDWYVAAGGTVPR